MPGRYTVEMLSLKYGRPTHNIRQALQACGIAQGLDDTVDVDAAEESDSKIKKWLADQEKEYLTEKGKRASHDSDKAKWVAEHNARVEAALAGGWEAAVAAANN